MKLSSFFIIVLSIPLILTSCKKRLETCSYAIQYHSPSIAFVGFSEVEMRSISISAYKANTNFNELVNVDSLIHSSIVFVGDTAYSKIDTMYNNAAYGFKSITEGLDYKIVCKQTGKTFSITNIKSGEARHTWTSEHCSPGASQTRFFSVSFDVDGVPAYPGNYGTILFLSN